MYSPGHKYELGVVMVFYFFNWESYERWIPGNTHRKDAAKYNANTIQFQVIRSQIFRKYTRRQNKNDTKLNLVWCQINRKSVINFEIKCNFINIYFFISSIGSYDLMDEVRHKQIFKKIYLLKVTFF